MEAFEIERKFLIKKLPEDLEKYECRQLEQGYLCIEPVVRIRRSDDTYTPVSYTHLDAADEL